MIDLVEVYVELMNEGTPCWRPTQAYRLNADIYVLSNENYDPDDEEWTVAPGSLITLTLQDASEGRILVATKYAGGER